MSETSHRERMDAFWEARTKVADPVLSTHFKRDGTHELDLAFVRRFTRSDARVLDLGAGSCLVSGKLAAGEEVADVLAVDKFPEFLSHAPRHPRLRTEASDLLAFETTERFDLVLLFGVMNYFSPDEARLLYGRCARWLSPGGVLVVKHQCGVHEDVTVDRHSEQIGTHYLAFYRHVAREEALLREQFGAVEVVDVYPPEKNPWPNTHFYAFVCRAP